MLSTAKKVMISVCVICGGIISTETKKSDDTISPSCTPSEHHSSSSNPTTASNHRASVLNHSRSILSRCIRNDVALHTNITVPNIKYTASTVSV